MQHNLRHFIVILTLVALTLGGGVKMNLCVMPDGDAHVERAALFCQLATESPVLTDAHASDDRSRCHAPCRDVALRSDASNGSYRNFAQLPLRPMIPIGPPIVPVLANQKAFSPPPPFTLPLLALQKSVVLLI